MWCFARIGVYFVFSISVHNYRISKLWDEREEELKSSNLRLTQLRDALLDEAFLKNAIKAINSEKVADKKVEALKGKLQQTIGDICKDDESPMIEDIGLTSASDQEKHSSGATKPPSTRII